MRKEFIQIFEAPIQILLIIIVTALIAWVSGILGFGDVLDKWRVWENGGCFVIGVIIGRILGIKVNRVKEDR